MTRPEIEPAPPRAPAMLSGGREREEVLVVVDLQRAFPIPRDLVDRIRNRMTRHPRCVFTRFVNPPGSLFRTKLDITSCLPGSSETALLFEPRSEDLVFDKSSYGLNAGHLLRLCEAGVSKAVVCGVDTDACVLGVAFSLFDAGIDCRVEPDLCWSANGLHDQAMAILTRQIGI